MAETDGGEVAARIESDPALHRIPIVFLTALVTKAEARSGLQIQGHPMKDGKPVADDVSGYKQLSLQLYATGSDYVRVEFISHGQGINLDAGFPQVPLKIKPGLNTYLIPLKGVSQPSWVQQRVDTKEVLKKLTAISISAYCNQCTPQQGVVAVDNLVFQK